MSSTAQTNPREDRWSLLRFLLGLGLAAFALRAFVFAPFTVPTGSMLPTVMIGDFLFATKWNYGISRYSLPGTPDLFSGRVFGRLPARGDVILFKYPGPSKVDYVKRAIAFPGEQVQMRGGILHIDGAPVPRTRIADWPMRITPNSPCRKLGGLVREERGTCFYPRYRETLPGGRSYDTLDQGTSRFDDTPVFIVPQGHLFAMGDNRDDSLDSRASVADRGVGFVPIDHLVGRAGVAIFSTDGSATLWKPWTWFGAARTERIGTTY